MLLIQHNTYIRVARSAMLGDGDIAGAALIRSRDGRAAACT